MRFLENNGTTNGTTPDAGGNMSEDFYNVLRITATVLGVLMLMYLITSPCRYNETSRALAREH